MDREGTSRNDGGDSILELTSAGNISEVTEVVPSSGNEVERGSSINNALDGRRSSPDMEAQSLPPSGEQEGNDSLREQKRSILSRLFRKRSKKRLKRLAEGKKDGLKEKRNGMMVVSVLLATLAYQAALNPPGGFWQDDQINGSANNSTATAPSSGEGGNHTAGTAINANINGFQWFLIANTVALFASLVIILLLTSAVTIRRRIMMWLLMIIMWISVFSVAFSFFSGVVIIQRDDLSYPAMKCLIYFGLGCMGLFAVLTILHALIGLKEIYRWLKEKIWHRENVDPVSHSHSNETA